jgi:hypothetical protein
MGKGGVIYVNKDKLAEFIEIYKNAIYNKAVRLSKGKASLKHLFAHISDNTNCLEMSHPSRCHNNLKQKIGYNPELVRVSVSFIEAIISKG